MSLLPLRLFFQGVTDAKQATYALRQEGGACAGFYQHVSEKDQFIVSGGDEGAVVVYEIATLKHAYLSQSDFDGSIEVLFQHA